MSHADETHGETGAEAAGVDTGECERVGVPMPDVAGVGIILAFSCQAFVSLALALWVFFVSRHGLLDVGHDEGTDEHAIELRRLDSVLDILMVGNDVQMLTGIGLMITCYVSAGADAIDLYHLHLIYDTLSFVGMSNAATLITWTFCATKHPDATKHMRKRHRRKKHPSKRSRLLSHHLLTARHTATYIYALSFLALAVLLLYRLSVNWSTSPTAPLGSCYRSAGQLASPGASHPAADRVFVAVTAVWTLAAILSAIFVKARSMVRKLRWVLLAAVAQFPLHLYAVVVLRAGNQGALESEGEGEGEGENAWDFGQTTAVLLLLYTLGEGWVKISKLWRFEKKVKARAAVKTVGAAKDLPAKGEGALVGESEVDQAAA